MAKPEIPIHDFSKDNSGSIPFRLEALEIKAGYDSTVPHRHNYYELFFFEKGGGDHWIDFEVLPIQDYSLHFLSPGQVHILKRSPGSFGRLIRFSRDFYYLNLENKDLLFEMPFFNNNTRQPVLNLSPAEFTTFQSILDPLEKEWNAGGTLREEMIRSWLNILLIQARRLFPEAQPETKPRAADEGFQNFRILLEKNFRSLHRPAEYASLLSITEKHLNEIVKSRSGHTVSSHIQSRIMLEARRLLLHSNLSAKEIGYFLNFEDPSYFNKVFKRNCGTSPNQFREQVRKELK